MTTAKSDVGGIDFWWWRRNENLVVVVGGGGVYWGGGNEQIFLEQGETPPIPPVEKTLIYIYICFVMFSCFF